MANRREPIPARTVKRRVTRACDFCHGRGIKCKPWADQLDSCLTCVEYGQQCTHNREVRRRGTKPRSKPLTTSISKADMQNSIFLEILPSRWHQSEQIVDCLLEIYLDSIHPVFPMFCEKELLIGWQERSFPASESQRMSLLCMCALSAQHAQNGAVFTSQISQSEFAELASDYLQAAVNAVPVDFTNHDILDLARSYGLLALLANQNSAADMVHKYLGLYHGLCGRYSLQDESRWPTGLDDCAIEVRRRLFWAMYRLDVHNACVMGHMIRTPEAQSSVNYPRGVHHPAFLPDRDGTFEDWFQGWNYTTDVYRILEHAITVFRSSRIGQLSILKGDDDVKRQSVIDTLAAVENRLLPQFSRAFRPSSDNGKNRSGFQATNILCTINLVKMVTSILQKNDVEALCRTAFDLIKSVQQVPPEYIRATGTPLIQQLAGAGYLLHGLAAKYSPQTQAGESLRNALHAMKVLIEDLSQHHAAAASAAMRLQAYCNELGLDGTNSIKATDFGLHPSTVQPNVPPPFDSNTDLMGCEPLPLHEYLPDIFLWQPTWPISTSFDLGFPDPQSHEENPI